MATTEFPSGSGTFANSSGSFFRIDGLLYGNQGNARNDHFTMHLGGVPGASNRTACCPLAPHC